MYSEELKTKGLNKFALQIIAVLAMLIDHLAVFVYNTPYYYIMKFIGRITIIIMCYFVAEGFYKTHNLGKYITRMGIFAVVSQIPYYLYLYRGQLLENPKGLIMSAFTNRNVIFTLFVGLCLLAIIKSNYKAWLKVIATLASLYLVRNSDWSYYGVLWVICFGLIRDNKAKQMLWAAIILIIKIAPEVWPAVSSVIVAKSLTYGMLDLLVMFGGFLALPLLSAYNGSRGKNMKLGLYIFYPVHLIVIVAVMIILRQYGA